MLQQSANASLWENAAESKQGLQSHGVNELGSIFSVYNWSACRSAKGPKTESFPAQTSLLDALPTWLYWF